MSSVPIEVPFSLIEVPFSSSGLRSGVARMPAALRDAGLHDVLRGLGELDVVEVDPGKPLPERGRSEFLAEDALGRAVAGTRDGVRNALDRGRLPLVVAGDCPMLIGAVAALNDRGSPAGLLFIDGHEDAWPPQLSPTGEASDSEIALALGLVDAPEHLQSLLPCVRPEHLVMLGARDGDELDAAGVPRLGPQVAAFVTAERLVGAAGDTDGLEPLVRDGVQLLGATAGWWLHIDLDVLSSHALAAVDYPQPGGLSWSQLREVCSAALQVPGCRGASVVIYNPDLDSGAAAPTIVDFLGFLATTLLSGTPRAG